MKAIQELKETVSRLRSLGGCPWDIEQSHQTIADCLIEECSELLESIDDLNFDLMLEELGDVLLQVVMHAQMAEESGHFNLEKVANEINDKLVRRHPHVFGNKKLSSTDEVLLQWNEIKAGEKNQSLDDTAWKSLPPRLPALLYAREVFKQIQKNIDYPTSNLNMENIEKTSDRLDEDRAGELLFEITAACRLSKIDPESALRKYTNRLMKKI